jgi:hypothetical protein
MIFIQSSVFKKTRKNHVSFSTRDRLQAGRAIFLLLSVLFLLPGFIIYALFRQRDLMIYDWVGIVHQTNKPLIVSNQFKNLFYPILVFNMPDALWLLSGIFFLRFTWFENKKWCDRYIFCFCCISIILELLQAINFIPGVFDIMDIIFLLTTTIIENIINRNKCFKRSNYAS